ncbi:spore coat protein [Peribacillus kribbensis]|uniref:spore coat protein n=1 Tax=Peribacillus kribbensis TaxID=356658 RepID=UPI0003F7256E|nr:spore coat protein [Peribacillus kribbensis]
MPNNMEGRGLTNREMLQLCLELEKGRSRSLGNTILETSHPELQDIYAKCFDNAIANHKAIFTMMDVEGWYETEPASLEQVERVQEFMRNNLHPDEQY